MALNENSTCENTLPDSKYIVLNEIDLSRCFDEVPKHSKLELLVCGRTGVGKSTLINGLVGQEICEVKGPGLGDYSASTFGPGTTVAKENLLNVGGVIISVWDTPGLQDDDKDRRYIENMYSKCKNVDLVLFCVDISTIRWADVDKTAMTSFNDKFGVQFWKRCVLVMTKANLIRVPAKHRENKSRYLADLYHDLQRLFQSQLIDLGLSESEARSIPAVALGYCDIDAMPVDRCLSYTSDRAADSKEPQDSLVELWVTALETICNKSREKFLRATANPRRIKLPYCNEPTEDMKALMEVLKKKIESDKQLKAHLVKELTAQYERYQKDIERVQRDIIEINAKIESVQKLSLELTDKHIARIAATLNDDQGTEDNQTKESPKFDKASIIEALGRVLGGGVGAVYGGTTAGIAGAATGAAAGSEIGRVFATGFEQLYDAIAARM